MKHTIPQNSDEMKLNIHNYAVLLCEKPIDGWTDNILFGFALLNLQCEIMITLKKVPFEPPPRNSYISFVCVTYKFRICLCYSFRSTPTFLQGNQIMANRSCRNFVAHALPQNPNKSWRDQKMKRVLITVSMLILLSGISLAGDSSLTISDMTVDPSTVSSGGNILISCQVTHSDGPMNIERVAATVSNGNLNSSYPMLYDDGTNGDKVAEDGIYSLEITAGNTAGESNIVFIAVDTEHDETESEPMILTVE